jgi:D-galactose 1-dehydrogenase
MKPTRLALIGMGKIARDQHLPAIADNPNFVLAATASRNEPGFGNVPHAKTLEALLATGTPFDAVVLCTPPQVRYPLAHLALSRGFHVFLEKPPGASLGEVEALSEAAAKRRLTLFASWHSRQAWIWEPGGLGVFDPGINALSILTHILPQPFFLTEATLSLPENRAAPIAAQMQFRDALGTPITMDLDWRETGPQRWDIEVETDAGSLKLSSGGAVLSLPTGTHGEKEREYPSLYEQFEKLLRTGTSDVDVRPLRHVADAFLRGHRNAVEAFYC